MADVPIFSIGHSNHSLARLVQLLQDADVTAVADVRSQPYSQRYPQFNRTELEEGVRQMGIAYAFLGDELGGRPRDFALYDEEGRVDYERVRKSFAFGQGLERLCRALDKYAVVMLCAEEDPMDCHRGLMIGPALIERGLLTTHLRADATHESTAEFEARLLAETNVGTGMLDGLFAELISAQERRELVAEAYRMQARRKAFRFRLDQRMGLAAEDQESISES
jgi:uncharacterized protein (DUF488 family)